MLQKIPYYVTELDEDRRRRHRGDKEMRPQKLFKWDADMMSHMFELHLRLNNIEYVWKEYEAYKQNQYKVPGELTEACVAAMMDKFLEASQFDRVFSMIELAVNLQMQVLSRIIKKLDNHPRIDEDKR